MFPDQREAVESTRSKDDLRIDLASVPGLLPSEDRHRLVNTESDPSVLQVNSASNGEMGKISACVIYSLILVGELICVFFVFPQGVIRLFIPRSLLANVYPGMSSSRSL